MTFWPPNENDPHGPLRAGWGCQKFFCWQIISNLTPLPKKDQKSVKMADLELLVPSPNKLNHSAVDGYCYFEHLTRTQLE